METKLEHNRPNYTRFLSEDKKVISNHHVWDIKGSNSPDHLNKHWNGQRALTDSCIGVGTRVFYEVEYQYTVIGILQPKDLVLEVGLGERDHINKYFYLGTNKTGGWSFCIYKEGKGLNLIAQHLFEYERIDLLHTDDTIGSNKVGVFNILVDRISNSFSLTNNGIKFHEFTDVISNAELCPVLSLYNEDKIDVRMKLIRSLNLTVL